MIPVKLVLVRGDTRDITLTMPDGATLLSSEVRFTARSCAESSGAVWEKVGGDGVTVSSDTEATAAITEADWQLWEDAGEPVEMAYDFEVRPDGSTVVTPGGGTIRVVWDVTR